MKILGIPCIGLNNMGEKVGKAVKELMELCQGLKSWNGKPWFGIFQPCPEEIENEELIYYVCIEVDSFNDNEEYPKGLSQVHILEQKYLVIQKGKEDSIRDVYRNLSSLLQENKKTQKMDHESYIIEIPEDEGWESVKVYVPIE